MGQVGEEGHQTEHGSNALQNGMGLGLQHVYVKETDDSQKWRTIIKSPQCSDVLGKCTGVTYDKSGAAHLIPYTKDYNVRKFHGALGAFY